MPDRDWVRDLFVRNKPVRYSPPDGPVLTGRFERFVGNKRQRAVVWFKEIRYPTIGRVDRARTVNVRYLDLTPEDAVRAERRRYRQQAVAAYPILCGLLTRRRYQRISADLPQEPVWELGRLPRPRKKLITEAVEQGAPLLPVITNALDAKPWMLRHVARHADIYYKLYGGRAVHALHALRLFTPETAPTEEEQLENLRYIDEIIDSIVDWDADQNRERLHRLIDRPEVIDTLRQYLHFLDELEFWIDSRVSEHLPYGPPGRRLGNPTIEEWIGLAEQLPHVWLGQLTELVPHGVDASSGVPEVRWPALFEGTVSLLGRYTATAIATRSELIAEGKAMRHCVATHLNDFLSGERHIVSIRDGSTHIATAAVEPHYSRGFAIVEAAGLADEPITPTIQAILDALIGDLRSRRIPCSFLHGARPADDEAIRQRARADLAPFGSVWRRGDPLAQHLNALAQVFGEQGFAQYRPCLEIAPGRGKIYAALLRAARSYRQIDTVQLSA